MSDKPPVTPAGHMIDGKNTLQSFACSAPNEVTSNGNHSNPISNQSPVLPTGELIDGKNTLQSFVFTAVATEVHSHIDSNDNDRDYIATADAVPLEVHSAYAVQVVASTPSPIVVAGDTVLLQPLVSPEATGVPGHKRSVVVLAFVIVVVVAVIAITLPKRGDAQPSQRQKQTPPVSTSKNSTSSPSPTPIEVSMLTTFINNITLSGRNISASGVTSEDLALKWMHAHDFNISSTTSTGQFRLRQRFALLALWFQQDVTSSSWNNISGWLVDDNECNWFGVLCVSMNISGIALVQNVVTGIDFFDEESDFYGNSFTGILPTDMGQLSNIRHLDFSHNMLYGTLPESIGQWTALTAFSVVGNSLFGTLPESIGQWTGLTSFDVSVNSFSRWLPESIGQWTALTSFAVYSNTLTGTLPESIGNWTALDFFYCYSNLFVGTLPKSIAQWTGLTYFSIEANQFTGNVSNALCQAIESNNGSASVGCGEVSCSCCTCS
jgi:hypothetical protein